MLKNNRTLVILICVVVACALLAGFFHEKLPIELFTDSSSPNDAIVSLKSQSYFPYIADFVYSNTTTSMATFDTGARKQIMNFLPTYADGLCSWNSNPPATCSNFYINNISFPDTYEFTSPMVCKSIETSVGVEKNQCMVRMLNNVYSIRKKCIRLTTSSNVEVYSGQTASSTSSTVSIDNATNIGTSSTFLLEVHGTLDLLALLRPSLISFGNFGLFHVESQINTTHNMFTSYSSLSSSNSLVMSIVSPPSTSINIYPGNNTAIEQLINNKDWNILSTIYYLNFEDTVYPLVDDTTYNTFNIIIDNVIVNAIKSSTNPLTTSTISLLNSAATTNICSSMTYTFNLNPLTGTVPTFFQVTLNRESSSTTPTVANVHPDFSAVIYTYMRNNELYQNPLLIYDICVTCTMDLVIIVAMIRDLNTGKSLFFMTQTPLTDSGVPYYVQFQGDKQGRIYKDSSKTIADDQLVKNHYNKFMGICPNTIVPNFAMLAKNLGYVI